MKHRRPQWQQLRSALIGVMLLLPLVPVLVPVAAAWANEGDVWCLTLPAGPDRPSAPAQAADMAACLVCLAASAGTSLDAPSPLGAGAPDAVVLATLVPGPLSGFTMASAAGLTPIRAPPVAARPESRAPASCAAGCALT